MERKKIESSQLLIGVALILSASLLTCIGQLCWKLSSLNSTPVFILLGLGLYGGGALLMMAAFRFGPLSLLHPMMSAGYVLSLLLGVFVLDEQMTALKIAGIFLLIIGLILLAGSERRGSVQ